MSSEKTISQKFREVAEELKSNKAKIADAVLQSISDARKSIKDTSENLKDFSDFVSGTSEIYSSSSKMVGEFLANESYTRSVKSVVQNMVSDVANRINEAGNVVEEVSKDEKMKNLMDSAIAAGKKAQDALDRISKRGGKSRHNCTEKAGSKFSVVRDSAEPSKDGEENDGTDPNDRTGANIS